MGNLHCKLAIRDSHCKLVIGGLHCKLAMGGLHCKVSMGGLHCKVSMGSLHCKLAMGGLHCKLAIGGLHCKVSMGSLHCKLAMGALHCKLAMGALQKKLKERCYLHSVQHSYENRNCKPEIKYFSSVNLWCTGVNHQFTVDYSRLQWITVVKKKGCYLHSVQHSYENMSCKPEIKYFSSVNCWFTGVICQFTCVIHQFTPVNQQLHRFKNHEIMMEFGSRTK